MGDKKHNEIIRLGLILFTITFITALLLAFVNGITKDKIAENSAKTKKEAMQQIFSNADSFDKLNLAATDVVTEGYTAKKDGKSIGYVISVEPQGFGGAISMLVGITPDKKVSTYVITNMNETPGLGTKAKDASFSSQFKDKTANIKVVKTTPSNNEVQAISGATISSNAVTKGINAALDAVSKLG
ncbi:MAG: RnfABCDGE type electron transport complex subunit G [Bacillota bacterium]|nr:RnfABCDGE type electron transport complex subunit G [Bacillota bacterium]